LGVDAHGQVTSAKKAYTYPYLFRYTQTNSNPKLAIFVIECTNRSTSLKCLSCSLVQLSGELWSNVLVQICAKIMAQFEVEVKVNCPFF